MSLRLDADFLDECRRMGDPDGDRLVALVFREISAAEDSALAEGPESGRPPARRLLSSLVEHDAVAPSVFPAPLKAFLDAAPQPPAAEPGAVARGQQIFAAHGPEIMMALGCYSLPAAYAANDGVKVLAQTGFLESHPLRRLVETAQMVVNVMRPGGLDRDGAGVLTARKVRLMHAAIRHLLLTRESAWDVETLGIPINQEDLAGTLMTFAFLPLQVLRRLGCALSVEDEDAYVGAWGGVGRIMGLRPELIPASADEAERLTRTIQRRQIDTGRPNPEGRALTCALLEMMEAEIPVGAMRFGPASLMRAFLPRDVAHALGIPRSPVGDAFVHGVLALTRRLRRYPLSAWLRHRVFRHTHLALIQAVLDLERGGKRTEFELPLSLRGSWQLE